MKMGLRGRMDTRALQKSRLLSGRKTVHSALVSCPWCDRDRS